MSFRWTVALQIGAMFLQTVVPAVPGFPAAWMPFCHALLTFLQGAQALLAHLYNPDGTQAMKLTLKAENLEAGR